MSYLDNLYTPPVLNEEYETTLNEKTKEEWVALGHKLRGIEGKLQKRANTFAKRKGQEQRSFYTPNTYLNTLTQHRANRVHHVANNVFAHAYGSKWRAKDLLK